jgi:plastocyanin
MTLPAWRAVTVVLTFGVGLAACGGGGGTTTPSPQPTNPYVFTISSAGAISPKELTVPPGTRVLFVNNDPRRHDMASDDHPDHQECPAINQVGVLVQGQSRETGNLNVVRTCGFHDHDDPDNNNLKGRIVVR